MACPKCGFANTAGADECARCGVVFTKVATHERQEEIERELAVLRPTYTQRLAAKSVEDQVDDHVDGRIGAVELRVLGIGLALAIVAYAFPLTRLAFSAVVTLFHELGHAVVAWLLGHPSIPAFDFVYGGGFTHMGQFQLPLALLIGAAFVYGLWLFRENRTTMILIGSLALFWLFFVTSEWRRELLIASAGHIAEFVMAGIFFYKALAGVGWKAPEVERPLGAFVAFFVEIHSIGFAWRLAHDPDFMAWYREGKGGALMNDLEVVALDLQIYARMHISIEGVARALLVFSVVPLVAGVMWYLQRQRWHRLLQSLRTADR